MSVRSLARRIVAGTAMVAATAGLSQAQSLTYTFATQIGGGPFGTLPFTFAFDGDASTRVDFASLIGAPAGASLYALQPTASWVTSPIFGGTLPFAATIGPDAQIIIGAGNGLDLLGLPFTNGVGFAAFSVVNDIVVAGFLPTATFYDLSTPTGPITGPALLYSGSLGSFDPSYVLPTDAMTFTATSAVTATPEPASLALLGTGLLAMGGVVARRRKQRA